DTHLDQVCAQVRESSAVHPDLRLSTGKKIFEFQPDLDWHKGRAVRWLMETLVLDPARVKPLYMGDDVTDEDAFHEVRTDGLGIVVDPEVEITFAAYRLDDAGEVEAFLAQMRAYLEDSNHE